MTVNVLAFLAHLLWYERKHVSKHWFFSIVYTRRDRRDSRDDYYQSVCMSPGTCAILARYHAPGAGWYWNPHTAAINISIYFLTYIFSHYFKKHIEIFFKNGGQQGDSNHRPIDHEPSCLTSTPARVLCRNIAFYPAWTFME